MLILICRKFILNQENEILKQSIKNLINNSEEISMYHSEIFSTIFDTENKESWAYFFPFIFSNNLPPSKKIYIYEDLDLILVFVHHIRNPNQIELFFPPLILNDLTIQQLKKVLKKIDQQNVRILWVDGGDKIILERCFGHQIQIEEKSSEYIFDPQKISLLQGSQFKDLRKKINSIKKLNPIFTHLHSEDIPETLDFLKNWRKLQGRKNSFLLDWGYTNSSVENFFNFDSSIIKGWKVVIESEIVAIGMAGKINPKVANFYVAKTNINIMGLSEFLRWRVFCELDQFEFVNDASDLGLHGLQQHKMKFRPIGFQPIYTANLGLTV